MTRDATRTSRQMQHFARLKASGGVRLSVDLDSAEKAALAAYAAEHGVSLPGAVKRLISAHAPIRQR